MLLSDEQICQEICHPTQKCKYSPKDCCEVETCRSVAKAQLTHCEPLIRAKVAQEILRKIDTAAKNDADICIGTVPADDCQTCDGYPTCFHLRLQEIKAEYEVKE